MMNRSFQSRDLKNIASANHLSDFNIELPPIRAPARSGKKRGEKFILLKSKLLEQKRITKWTTQNHRKKKKRFNSRIKNLIILFKRLNLIRNINKR
jgi:hypothetical protein